MARYFVEYRITPDIAGVVVPPRGGAPVVARAATTADVVAPQPAPLAAARALAVDALRGLGILVMVLGETKPYEVLPAWMYHAQEPPPTHVENLHLPGLTFPDLVFPFFLFTLGVAIPLSLSGRLSRGVPYTTAIRGAVTRGLLLLFLALFREHFALVPSLVQPERTGWLVALAGFPVLCAIFTRLPRTWSRWLRAAIRAAGWGAAIAMFALVRFPDGSTFDPNRYDIILIAAAVCVVGGTLTWLATRNQLWARLAVIGAVAYVAPPYVEYLCITLPGTIAGDVILKWLRPGNAARTVAADIARWSRARAAMLATVLGLFVPLLLVGIQSRYVGETTVGAAVLCVVVFLMSRRPGTPPEHTVAQLIPWGAAWLMLGLGLDPIEGGTQKVPPTFAWMFQCVGLAIMLIAAFTIIIEILSKRWLQLLVDNGQNPMIAYVGYATLVLPLLGLTTIKAGIDSMELNRWVLLAWGVMTMLLVASVVRAFTRRRIFWRT